MEYTWDEAKRLSNLQTHRLDFQDAWQVYEAQTAVTHQAHDGPGQERREMALARVAGRVLTLVYTRRGAAIHCMSLRPASRKERRIYYGATGQDRHLHDRGTPADAEPDGLGGRAGPDR